MSGREFGQDDEADWAEYVQERIDERRCEDAEDRKLDERFMRERRARESGSAAGLALALIGDDGFEAHVQSVFAMLDEPTEELPRARD